jgi:beta-N-acetylhexosaminidase
MRFRRPAYRRAVMWAVLVALGVGALAGAGLAGSTSPARLSAAERPFPPPNWAQSAASRLSLNQQVGQVLIGAFSGLQAPRSTRSALRSDRLAGVILFGKNVRSPPQLRRLTGSLQRSAGGSALVSVDQEGGLVRRIPFAGPRQGQPSQASAARVGRLARSAGRTLRRLGVNVNFAPVADVPSGPGADISRRAFHGSPSTVGKKVAAGTSFSCRGSSATLRLT